MKQVVIFATFKAREGSADLVNDQLVRLASRCKLEAGCLNYQPHRDIKQPETFYLHEVWENKALLKAHGEAAPLREFREAVAGHLESTEARFARSIALA